MSWTARKKNPWSRTLRISLPTVKFASRRFGSASRSFLSKSSAEVKSVDDDGEYP